MGEDQGYNKFQKWSGREDDADGQKEKEKNRAGFKYTEDNGSTGELVPPYARKRTMHLVRVTGEARNKIVDISDG